MAEIIKTNGLVTQIGKPQTAKAVSNPKSEFSGDQANTVQRQNYDSATIDVGWKDKAEMEATIKQLFESLKKQFPKVEIWVNDTALSDEDFLSQMNSGIFLVVSDEFMEALKNGGQDYQKRSKVLTDLMRKLSSQGGKPGTTTGAYLEKDRAILWKASDKQESPDEIKQKQKQEQDNLFKYLENKDDSKNKSRITLNPGAYNVASAYGRMAHARNKLAVQGVVQQVRRQISSLQLASAYGDDKQRMQARAALRSCNKLLLRGNRKIRQLSEEELTNIRRKRAVEQQQEQKAEHIREEQRRRRTSGRIRDAMLVKEGQLEELQIPGYKEDKHRLEHEYVPYIAPDMAMPAAGVPMSDVSAAGGAGNIEFTVVEVQQF